MKSKSLLELGSALSVVFKQYNRADFVRKLASDNADPFAQVLFYENLIVFQIGIIFEQINLLHFYSLFKNTQKYSNYDLPNLVDLMDSYTLGSIIKLTKSVLSSYPDVIKNLNKFNSDRNGVTHKMFDVDKIPTEEDLLQTAKNLAILGKNISTELSSIAREIDAKRKKIEKPT